MSPYGILSVLENFQRATKLVERYPHALGRNDNVLSTSRSYTEYLSKLRKVFKKMEAKQPQGKQFFFFFLMTQGIV